jgi:acyl dehydratase
VGTLVFSIVVGITVPDISGKAIANLEYEKVEHLAPVFINDTIYAESEILEVRESKSKLDRGIIYVETIAYNQNKVPVLKYRRRVLIPKKGE